MSNPILRSIENWPRTFIGKKVHDDQKKYTHYQSSIIHSFTTDLCSKRHPNTDAPYFEKIAVADSWKFRLGLYLLRAGSINIAFNFSLVLENEEVCLTNEEEAVKGVESTKG